MRKLASVQYVHHIEPIEGADRIELVKVLGWQCVTPKGDFKVGDLCVYFEVDSFLPICDKFEFLRNSSYKKTSLMGEGFRLKTIKLRGQLSQGLVQPLSILYNNVIENKELPFHKYEIGDDVTKLLGVRKFMEEEHFDYWGTMQGDFPSPYFEPSDEIRVQSIPAVMEEFKNKEIYISTKMDGTSMSVYKLNGHYGVCNRNKEFVDGSIIDFFNKLGLNKIPEGFMVQGELCGPNIQKNRLKLKQYEWYVFTIQTPNGRLGLNDMLKFCKEYKLKHVPIEETKMWDFDNVDSILERAKGKYPSGLPKEGIVIRPTTPVQSETLGTWLSVKALNNNFLLKE